jgi:hypothetical protein
MSQNLKNNEIYLYRANVLKEGKIVTLDDDITNILIHNKSRVTQSFRNPGKETITVWIGSSVKFYNFESCPNYNNYKENFYDQFQKDPAKFHFEGNFRFNRFNDNPETVPMIIGMPHKIMELICATC